jgi:hypothetical protein
MGCRCCWLESLGLGHSMIFSSHLCHSHRVRSHKLGLLQQKRTMLVHLSECGNEALLENRRTGGISSPGAPFGKAREMLFCSFSLLTPTTPLRHWGFRGKMMPETCFSTSSWLYPHVGRHRAEEKKRWTRVE